MIQPKSKLPFNFMINTKVTLNYLKSLTKELEQAIKDKNNIAIQHCNNCINELTKSNDTKK